MAFNPNAVFISPSSLADFEKCPQLYYYRNVFKTPRGLKIQLINPSLALGQSIHETLEQFLKLGPIEKTKDELLKIFDFTWQGLSGDKGGFENKDQEEEFKKRALAMLNRFWSHEHFKKTDPVKIPSFPKVELGNDIILTGKLDWIEKEGDGYYVVDFKTGKNEEKENSIQLPIYAVLVSNLFATTNIRASYWYLDKDKDLVSFSLPDLKKTFEEIKVKGETIKLVRQTSSYKCQSGKESCWACQDMLTIAKGKGKLVTIDAINRKQEIYILPKEEKEEEFQYAEDLPF